MTKVRINPGVCNLITTVTAEAQKKRIVKLTIESDCPGVSKILETLGTDTVSGMEMCFAAPGTNAIYQAAGKCCPAHGTCPVCSGITKCIEAEAGLALKRPVEITFIEE